MCVLECVYVLIVYMTIDCYRSCTSHERTEELCKVYPGVTDHPDFTGDSGLGFKLKECTGLCPRDQELCLREQELCQRVLFCWRFWTSCGAILWYWTRLNSQQECSADCSKDHPGLWWRQSWLNRTRPSSCTTVYTLVAWISLDHSRDREEALPEDLLNITESNWTHERKVIHGSSCCSKQLSFLQLCVIPSFVIRNRWTS